MTDEAPAPLLTEDDLRHITRWAILCAERALPLFEAAVPGDSRPGEAIAAALAFAEGGPRTATLRKAAWSAQAAARAVDDPAAKAAARAAIAAAGAPYTHPIETPHQINHILGPAAYAIQALSLGAEDQAFSMETELRSAIAAASQDIRRIIGKMPGRKPSKGAFHTLLYRLDTALRPLTRPRAQRPETRAKREITPRRAPAPCPLPR
ncbi:putative immunity protein [Ensifer sp. 2YAB10]|uniref:putative immunity protein n=1 Tax=unclassified Ensifer TaxID=2633371 RepID=UPI003F93BC1C